ncbi:MAG: hypothetical protein ACK2UK_21315 [Candidatus Promineifilaceae bacterium]
MGRLTRYFKRPQVSASSKPAASRWPLYMGVILGICLSYLLYNQTLGVPFLQEDSTHIRWLSWHNPLEVFLSARGAPDYRPLGKAIIKVWYLILGHHDRIWLRSHNLAFNALSIAFIALIASWVDRSERRYWTGALAAILFGAFPFAYQAIPWINNFFYPLANLLLLAMTAVYWQARVRNSNRLLVLAFLLLFIAPFEIEYGLMGSSLLFLVELVLWIQKRQPYPWLTGPLFGLALDLLFLARSLTIPKQSYGFGLPTPWRLVLISTYFLQGLMYPISPLATRVMSWTGWGDVAAIWAVCLPALLILLAVLFRRGQRGLILLGLGWFVLLNLPAFVFVDFDYVVNSPRLLYPPGVGIVWLWGGFLSIITIGEKMPRLRMAGGTVVVLAIVVMSGRFVRQRNFLYLLAQQPVLQLAEIARQSDPEEELLIVNFPSWLAPQERQFAMGNHGVQIIPFYINIQELIYAHNDSERAARAVQFANIRQPQPYYYGMLGEQVDYDKLAAYLADSGPVYLARWSADAIDLLEVGRLSPPAIDTPDAAYTFGDQLQLQIAVPDGEADTLTARLRWRLDKPVDQDLTVFVHLYGPDGNLVVQADGYPIGGMAPFWLLPVGTTLEDVRTVPLPETGIHGLKLGVGVYNSTTGERLAVTDSSGTRLQDDVVLLEPPGA